MEIQTENVLYFICGANGSGKSTLVENLFGKKPIITFVNADNIAHDAKCSPKSTNVVRGVCEKIDNALSHHESFIYETTLSAKFDGRLIERVKAAGYSIEFFYVTVSKPDDNVKRVAARKDNGGHNVRLDDILRRRKKSLYNLGTVLGQVHNWHLYDNTEDGAPHKLIAEGCTQKSGGQQVTIIKPELYSLFEQNRNEAVAAYLDDERARIARLAAAQKNQSK